MECLFDPKDSVLQKKLAQKKSLRGGKSRPGGPKCLQGGGGCPPTSRAYAVRFLITLKSALSVRFLVLLVHFPKQHS